MNLDEFFHGIPGSVQHSAHEIRSSLCPIEVFGLPLSSEDEEKRAQRMKEIIQASHVYDSRYFRRYADGLDMLKLRDLSSARDPRVIFLKAYFFLREVNGKPPVLQDVINLTDRMRAVTLKRGRVPRLPLPNFDPNFEREIQLEVVPLLPKQKWSRFYKPAGLEFSKMKRGPKLKSPAKRRPNSKRK
jgi:hypothetical protein